MGMDMDMGMDKIFRCKCIKLYVDDVFFDRDLFTIDKWYDVYKVRSYYIIIHDRNSYPISKKIFKEHFSTIQELREVEIDKILNV